MIKVILCSFSNSYSTNTDLIVYHVQWLRKVHSLDRTDFDPSESIPHGNFRHHLHSAAGNHMPVIYRNCQRPYWISKTCRSGCDIRLVLINIFSCIVDPKNSIWSGSCHDISITSISTKCWLQPRYDGRFARVNFPLHQFIIVSDSYRILSILSYDEAVVTDSKLFEV